MCRIRFCPRCLPSGSISTMQTKVILTLDHATGDVNIQADNLPDGTSAYYCLMRLFAAAQNVVCDQLEDKRLVVAKAFKPMLKL